MKRLRKLALDLDRGAWPNDYGYGFYLKSRPLCNYVERHLKKTPVELVDSTKLCITGSQVRCPSYRINSSNIACLEVPFDKVSYDNLMGSTQTHNFIVQFLRTHLADLPHVQSESMSSLLTIIDNFQSGGYLNTWTHKKRKFPKYGISGSLNCSLTLESFQLFLVVDAKTELYSRCILTTDPDELAYHYRFKDLVVRNDVLTVTSRTDEELFSLPLSNVLPSSA